MPIFGAPLVPAVPCGPSQHTLNALLCGEHETPEEAPNLADTQRDTSPREVLKAVRLLGVGPCGIFFNGGCDMKSFQSLLCLTFGYDTTCCSISSILRRCAGR